MGNSDEKVSRARQAFDGNEFGRSSDLCAILALRFHRATVYSTYFNSKKNRPQAVFLFRFIRSGNNYFFAGAAGSAASVGTMPNSSTSNTNTLFAGIGPTSRSP